MPLPQFVRKLTGRESPRKSQRATVSGLTTELMYPQGAPMECDYQRHHSLETGEVFVQDGRRSPCSPSCSTSSEDAVGFRYTGAMISARSMTDNSSTKPEFMVGSLPSSLSGGTGPGAAARAMRAKGKAALRTSTLDTDELPSASLIKVDSLGAAQQSCLSRESSLVSALQLSSSLRSLDRVDSGSSSSNSSLAAPDVARSPDAIQRSATDPLPRWTSNLTVSTSQRLGSTAAVASTTTAPPAAVTAAADDDDSDDESVGSQLVSPSSALAGPADDAFWCEDCELHCEWEDGVVAGWFQDLGHPELLEMLHSEEEVDAVDKMITTGKQQQEPARTTSGMSMDAVYTSSLYG